jgi:NitT/TauT family transport system substrate-binding protein
MKRIRKITMAGVIVMITMQIMSCKNSDESKLTIGYLPINECLPLFVANDLGYFEHEGIKVELVQFPGGGQAIEALKAQSIDIAFSNIVSAIFAKTNGINVKPIWGTNVEDGNHVIHGLLVNQQSTIKSIADLKGKIIALNNRRNIDELMIRSLLESNKIETFDLYEVSFPRMYPTLLAKKVDAIATVEPHLSYSISKNMRNISSYYIKNNTSIEVTSYFIITGNRNEIKYKKFITAMNSAIKRIRDDEKNCRSILKRYVNFDKNILSTVMLPLFRSEIPTQQGYEYLQNLMIKNKWINKKIDYNNFIAQ